MKAVAAPRGNSAFAAAIRLLKRAGRPYGGAGSRPVWPPGRFDIKGIIV